MCLQMPCTRKIQGFHVPLFITQDRKPGAYSSHTSASTRRCKWTADDTPETVELDRKPRTGEEKPRDRADRVYLWRSRQERESWMEGTAKALTAPRLAYCASVLRYQGRGLELLRAGWGPGAAAAARKPKKM